MPIGELRSALRYGKVIRAVTSSSDRPRAGLELNNRQSFRANTINGLLTRNTVQNVEYTSLFWRKRIADSEPKPRRFPCRAFNDVGGHAIAMQPNEERCLLGTEFRCDHPPGDTLHQRFALRDSHIVNAAENFLDEDDGAFTIARRKLRCAMRPEKIGNTRVRLSLFHKRILLTNAHVHNCRKRQAET